MIELVRRLEDIERRLRTLETAEVAQAGTFVPTLVGTSTAGTFTYDATNTTATWVRSGNLIVVNGRLRVTAITVAATGDVTLRTLPYTAATTGRSVNGGGVVHSWTGIDVPAGFTEVACQVIDAETQIVLIRNGDAATSARVQGGELLLVGGQIDLRFTVLYTV